MPIVHEDMDLPGGTAPIAEVTIQLAGTGCRPFHGTHPPNIHILGPKVLRPGNGIDASGYWEINLVGNDDISPSGTAYLVTRRLDDRQTRIETCIEVPVSGGPYPITQLDVNPPGDIPAGAVSQAQLENSERNLDARELSAQALSLFRAQVARAKTPSFENLGNNLNAVSASVIIVGDSNAEAFSPTARGLMWTRLLAHRLSGHRMGGIQYLPSAANTLSSQTPADWPGGQPVWTYSVAPAPDTFHGGDLHAVTMVSGSTATLTFFGDGVNVLYTRTPGGPAAAAVSLDGVAQSTIAAQGSESPGLLQPYTADGYGFHTLVVTSTAGALMLEGATVSDGEILSLGIGSRAVRTLAFGHAGFPAQFFAERPNWSTSAINLSTNAATGAYPGLVIVVLLANDQLFGRTQAQAQADLINIMTQVDTKIDAKGVTQDPGFLMLMFPGIQQQYIDAAWGARQLYGEDRVGVLDLRQYLPGRGVGTPPWGILDASGHANDAGQVWIADTVADFILGDLGRTFMPDPRPGYNAQDIVIDAATPAVFRLNWTEALSLATGDGGEVRDSTAASSAVAERRHRQWFEAGTYQARLRYGFVPTTGGELQVLAGGVSMGTTGATTGTDGNVTEVSLGTTVTFDSPGPRPVVIRKTGLNAAAARFIRLYLRKTV